MACIATLVLRLGRHEVEWRPGSDEVDLGKCRKTCAAPIVDGAAPEGSCAEGSVISGCGTCTPRCKEGLVAWPPYGKVPSFGELPTCNWGKMWQKFTCETPDAIPHPGIKRGVGSSKSAFQLSDIGMYDWNHSVGWWYSWSQNVATNSCWNRPGPKQFEKDTNYAAMMAREFELDANHGGWDAVYSDTQFILGWNEPYGDKDEQGRPKYISPAKAYASLVDYEKEAARIAKANGGQKPQLVSPAISPKPKGFRWAKEYFCLFGDCKKTGKIDKAAIRARLSYIAVHWYRCSGIELVSGLDKIYEAFGLPIWLTEFGCGVMRSDIAPKYDKKYKAYYHAPASVDLQLEYMKVALPLLEMHPHVVRYAWFCDQTSKMGGSSSLVKDGSFTKLGQHYNNYAKNPPVKFNCN